ncbi:peptidase U62 [bacterium]|nr:peptidase U62 [bacterium]
MHKEKYSEKNHQISVSVVQTQIESVRTKDIARTGLRVFENQKIGVAGVIGSYKEEELEQLAIEALEQNIPYTYELSREHQETADHVKTIIPEEEFVEEVNQLLKKLKKEQPSFSFFNKITLSESEVSLCNDLSLDLKYSDRYLELELGFKDKASANIIDGFCGYVGREYDRALFISLVNRICEAFKNQLKLPYEGKYKVIFATDYGLPMMKFIQGLNGLYFGTRSSIFSGKIGKQLFNEHFTLFQTLHPDDCLAPFFDAEGVVNPGYRYPLIENGILKSPYTDKKVAALFNLPHTGSAVCSYDGVPAIGYQQFNIQETESTLKELIGGETAIFVVMAAGGDFTPQGNFGTPVQLGLLFDGENFTGRLPQIQLNSTVFKMFGENFVGVSSDKLFPLSDSRGLVIEMDVSPI